LNFLLQLGQFVALPATVAHGDRIFTRRKPIAHT
jgi:hypothetical protein